MKRCLFLLYPFRLFEAPQEIIHLERRGYTPDPSSFDRISALHTHLFPDKVATDLYRTRPHPPSDAELLIRKLDAVPPPHSLRTLSDEKVLNLVRTPDRLARNVHNALGLPRKLYASLSHHVRHDGLGGEHDGRVEGRVAVEADGAGVVAAELAQLDDQGRDARNVPAQDDLVLAVDVGDGDLLDGGHVRLLAQVGPGRGERRVAQELFDHADQRAQLARLHDQRHHAVLRPFSSCDRVPRALRHGFRPPPYYPQRVPVV